MFQAIESRTSLWRGGGVPSRGKKKEKLGVVMVVVVVIQCTSWYNSGKWVSFALFSPENGRPLFLSLPFNQPAKLFLQ